MVSESEGAPVTLESLTEEIRMNAAAAPPPMRPGMTLPPVSPTRLDVSRLESGALPDQVQSFPVQSIITHASLQIMEWVQAAVDELTTARNTLKVR